ncbi:hypothetical protein CsSME_00051472 [Camellia sinensis var. sinensis]
MRHEKQENVMLPGQTCPPQRFQGDHTENRILRPPSGNFDVDSLGGSSRKRKSTLMDQPGAISESNFQYCSPWKSNAEQANLLSGAQEEENTHGLCLNQTKAIEPTTSRHQFENDHFHHQNCYSGSWMTSNESFHGNGSKNMSNAFSHVPPHPLEYKGSFDSFNMQAGESVVVSNWQPQAHNMLGLSEGYTSFPFSKPFDAHTGKVQGASHFEELMSFGIKNHATDQMALGMCNTPSKSVSAEILQQSFLKPKGHSDDMDRRTCSQENKESEISYELRQSSHCTNNGGINYVPTIEAASLGSSLCIEQNRNISLLQNEVQFGSSGSLGACLGKKFETEEQSLGDGSVKIKEKTEASDMMNLKHPLPEESSSKTASPANIVENGQKSGPDEKSKSHLGKAASVVSEKLWDGPLQLNSSVTVSAVAFFKSGEKLLDTNWGESVEVKGKVRLEAFEKYIQDLPRSRNRGLMVISLCWKEGSSETGLKGMKEIAKGYKKGERVGFAKLSPGIDLYICPRSDAIITILAKYGFFKGMAAVEDNRDSMIGCVVWRRNKTSSNSVVKKPESKSNSSQPLNSPSDSPMLQAAEKHLSVTKPTQASSEGVGKSGCESKNVNNSSKIPIEISNSFLGPNSLLTTSSVPGDSTSTPVGLPKPVVETHLTCCSGSEQPKASELLKEITSLSDDDDLPEYDFTTVCGISQTNMSKPSGTVLLDKIPLTEGIRNTGRSVLPGTPNVLDHSMLPRPSLKKNCEGEPQIPVFPSREERQSIQNKVTTTLVGAATVFAPPKNLFDDDDDMPEWCPPELRRQSLVETVRASTTMSSELPNPTFRTSAQGPPRPGFPSATYQSFSSQAFHPTFHCPTKGPSPPPARPLERGLSSSMGFNAASILGPPPNSGVRLPFHPVDKRRRRT